MQVIWKYPLAPRCTHEMPAGAQILTVQEQDGVPMLWALVDPDLPMEGRVFVVVQTGERFDGYGLRYIGTFQTNFVYHAFEQAPVFGRKGDH